MSRLLFFVLGSVVTLSLGFGWHAQRGRSGHRLTPEGVRDSVGWVLRGVDASGNQVDAIAGIVDEAIEELEAARDQHHERFEAFAEALAAPELDRAALERLRAESIALADTASSQIVDALAEVSAQLTPEQRAELLESHERFHGRFRGRWHGDR